MDTPQSFQPQLHDDKSSQPQKSQAQQVKFYKKLLIILGSFAVVLLILTFVFGAKAFINDDKLNQATKEGQLQGAAAQKSIDEKKFTDEKNSDFRTYTAPQEAGSFQVSIPKSWSLAITLNDSSALLSALSMPDFVDTKLEKYALRFGLQNKDIEAIKKPLDNLTKETDPRKRKLNSEEVTVSGIKGTKYIGQISSKIPNGTLVVLPLRDKTFTIQTDDNAVYSTVFNSILNNLHLNP